MEQLAARGYLPGKARFAPADYAFSAFLLLLAGITWHRYAAGWDIFEKGIFTGCLLAAGGLGRLWKSFRPFFLGVLGLSLLAISQYHGQLAAAEQNFWLRFFIGSQTAIMWMSALYVLATLTYWGTLLSRSVFVGRSATALTWAAAVMGFVGLAGRWYESYLIGPDVGHIPISNLYEVFILFSLLTSLLYLYYEARYRTRQFGAFALLVISAAIGFLLWYTFDRQANAIQPLVPALQSYWMKMHVPANFIGYGGFSLAAMLGIAYLLKANNGLLADRLPELAIIDDLMYKCIAVGFAFFTLATILGALWAAEAWGGYWSWDPKETWALIVWLNYAAWLHLRLVKGKQGKGHAWWAIVGLLVTTFAFLGVNMFLSGLHSYGKL
jgi:cytochrome c-type biogenesis protein CcsB